MESRDFGSSRPTLNPENLNGDKGRPRDLTASRATCFSSVLRTQVHNNHGSTCTAPGVSSYIRIPWVLWHQADLPDLFFIPCELVLLISVQFLMFWCHCSLKDDDLAGRMGLQPKELNKVIAVLSNDSLVKMCVLSTHCFLFSHFRGLEC